MFRIQYSTDSIEWHESLIRPSIWRYWLSILIPFISSGGDKYIRFIEDSQNFSKFITLNNVKE